MPHTIVIFGASGDLTSRKLIPALYRLFQRSRLPAAINIVGFSRSEMSDETWRNELAKSTAQHVGSDFHKETWEKFAAGIYYHPGDIKNLEDFKSLSKKLDDLDQKKPATRLYYLSTLPALYPLLIQQLGASELISQSQRDRRVVIEKPFGTDLQSARELNRIVHQVVDEQQVYRIDHYLGKETVQNLLVLRFANSIFEPIWNRNYVDHVQITVAEEVTVGRRGAFYDAAGVLRDMFQNHIMQLMTIIAMEAPARFDANFVRDEKVKVLRAIRPLQGADFAQNTIRAQYQGYRQEQGVPPNSQTATFAVLKLFVENWRWNGVPFFLRSGKAMSCRTTQIVIQFREPPHMLFSDGPRSPLDANRLVIQIQPAEGIQLHFHTKVPDAGMRFRLTDLNFSFQREFAGEMPDAYQRLLLDAFNGDPSLFARSDEVELAWSIIDPIHAAWNSPAAPRLETYPVEMWGPDYSREWMENEGRQWFDVCPVLD
jgi:glucose-6-phosphate 1-dehydrogenase